MAAKPANTAADEPAVVQWFASLFGQCWKEPSTAEDLQFDDLDAVDRKAKADQKPKRKQAAAKEAAAAPLGAKGAPPTASRGEQVGSPFLIDNNVLQIKSHPGVAFRHSKSEADKVRSGPGPAKWGETVCGIDEGDGWLKVGNFYLPMMYQGVAIITPVAAQKAEVEVAAKGTPQSPSRAPATPVRNAPSSPKCLAGSPGAVQAEGRSTQEAEAPEPPPLPEQAAASPEAPEVGAQASPAEAAGTSLVPAPEREAPETQPAWFAKPSVGTWLLPVPAVRRGQSEQAKEQALEPSAPSNARLTEEDQLLEAKTPTDCCMEEGGKVEASAPIEACCAEEQLEACAPLDMACVEKVEASAPIECCFGDKLEASVPVEACCVEEESNTLKIEAIATIDVEACCVEEEINLLKLEAMATFEACCVDEATKAGAPVEAQRVEWHLLPSVGTWLHRIPQ